MKKVSNEKNRVEFLNLSEETISGVLLKHDTTKPLLVICHGYGSSMEEPAIKRISTSLYERGYNVFTFNFSKSARETAIAEQVADIKSILNHFKNYKNFILLAGSLGALSTVIVSQRSQKIKSLITVNGFFGTRHLGKKLLRIYLLFKITSLFNDRSRQIQKYLKNEFHPEDIQSPVLVIHSLSDKDVSIKQSQIFYKKLHSKKEFKTLTDADHLLTSEGSTVEVVKMIDDWLRTLTSQ